MKTLLRYGWIAFLAGFAIGLSLSAFAQKGPDLHDHDWIRDDPQYQMESGTHCCDRSHCHPLNDRDVVLQDGGYLYKPTGQFFREGDPGVYQSKEWKYFGCGTDYRLWCFFIAPGGV